MFDDVYNLITFLIQSSKLFNQKVLKSLISSNVYTINDGFASIYYVFHSTYRYQFRFRKSAVMFCSLSAHSPHLSKCGGAKIEDKDAVSVPLLSCTKDVTSCVRSLGVSGSRGREAHAKVTEQDLIFNRAEKRTKMN